METEALVQSLLEAFATVPDHHSPQGHRHPLIAILALSTAAMFAGARSLYAIAQWGRPQPPSVVHALGFTRERTPCAATLHRVFSHLDVTAFEQALQRWVQAHAVRCPGAIDGQSLRGIHGEKLPGCAWLLDTWVRPALCWCKRAQRP